MMRQSLRSEFALILLCFVTGVGIIVSLDFDTAGRVEQDLHELRDLTLPRRNQIGTLDIEARRLTASVERALRNKDRDQLIHARAEAIQLEEQAQQLILKDHPLDSEGLLRLASMLDRYEQGLQVVIDERPELEITPARTELGRIESGIRSSCSYLLAESDRYLSQRLSNAVRRNAVQARAGLIIGIVATLLLILVIFSILRRILNRLGNLTAYTESVSQGQLDGDLDLGSLGRDELGQLGAAFLEMTHGLRRSTVSRDYVDNILKSMADALIVLDADLRVRSLNRAGEQLLGYKAEELRGRSLAVILGHPRNAVTNLIELCEMLYDESRTSIELHLTARDGTRVPTSFSASLLEDADGWRYVVAVAQDITERKHIELEREESHRAAEEANAAKDQFLANVSHELRTPLNNVLGMTEILLGTDLSPEQQDYAKTALEAGQSLLAIIDELLDFSHLAGEDIDLKAEECELLSVLEDAVTRAAPRAEEKSLDLTLFVDNALPSRVMLDRTRLLQVLDQLLDNAVRFTEKGNVHLQVGPHRVVDAREGGPGTVSLRFTVRDTGIGVAEDKRQLIFEAFRQSADHYTRQHGGTGLGLAIAKSIVERMGGMIDVESEEGKGSTFHFTVNLKVPRAPRRESHSTISRRIRRSEILVVDPRPVSRQVLAQTIRGWMLQSVSAQSGMEAVEKLHEMKTAGRPVAVVLCAADLPDMTGEGLVQALRNSPTGASVPVVMIARDSRLQPQLERERLGISAEIARPVLPSALLSAISHALDVPAPRLGFIPGGPKDRPGNPADTGAGNGPDEASNPPRAA